MTTTESGIGAPPFPSISVPPSRTSAAGCTCANGPPRKSANSRARQTTSKEYERTFLTILPPYGRILLDSLEVLFDFAPGDAKHHGAAVRANRRILSAAEFVENVRH